MAPTQDTIILPAVPLLPITAEEDDHLSPLIMDNHHTVEHHQETFKSATRLIDVVIDRIHEIPEFHPSGHHHAPVLRDCEQQVSMGSVDSDVSIEANSSQDNSPRHVNYLSSDDNAKDSGCDLTAADRKDHDDDEEITPAEIPDDELAAQIVTQVEFYFSNDNILKDAFLLKHVRRNKEGFVSLKLISSFKRVRQLTRDWRVVGYAIRNTSCAGIQVNDIGTKVRRLEALPVFDETMPSRTVVATDLPAEKLTIECVSELFGKCGDIALIRILRPGGTIPADVRQFYNKHPELHERECALVEFTESEAARVAQQLEGIQTFEMVAPKKKTGKKATISKIIENYKYPSYHDVERSRGGDGSGAADYKYNHTIRRGSAGYFSNKTDGGPHGACTYRKTSFTNGISGDNCEHYRRVSNCSIGSGTDLIRKFSNCSDGYCSEISRRSSFGQQDASSARRASQCSDAAAIPFRRSSNCSIEFCACSRRSSQCSDNFRRPSQCNEHVRRFSNVFERRTSIPGPDIASRRGSYDHHSNNEFVERKMSAGSFTGNAAVYEHQHHRKSSAAMEPMRKVSIDKFYDSRKISSDSGYDRRGSIGSTASDYGNVPMVAPRPKNGVAAAGGMTSIQGSAVKPDAFVRTPIGPDGSKGFSSRTRKMGQVIGLV